MSAGGGTDQDEWMQDERMQLAWISDKRMFDGSDLDLRNTA